MKSVAFALILAQIVTSALIALSFVQHRHAVRAGEEAHDAICALYTDLSIRVATSEQYLRDHPRGVVSPATDAIIISAAQIQQGIDNQKRTMAALDTAVNCTTPDDHNH